MTGGAPALDTSRLTLRPLRPEDAADLHAVLDDPALHVVIGGEPPTAAEWAARVDRWQRGTSPDGAQRWLNWVVRGADDGVALGHLQATVVASGDAEVAWVVGTEHQGRGYATEAARAVCEWLLADGAGVLSASIRPGHTPSERVAAACGMTDTGELDDEGESRWERRA